MQISPPLDLVSDELIHSRLYLYIINLSRYRAALIPAFSIERAEKRKVNEGKRGEKTEMENPVET